MSGLELAGTLVGSIFGSQVLVTLVQGWFNRKKTTADASEKAAGISLKLVETLTQRIDKLEAQRELDRKEILDLHKEVVALRTELGMYKDGKISYTISNA